MRNDRAMVIVHCTFSFHFVTVYKDSFKLSLIPDGGMPTITIMVTPIVWKYRSMEFSKNTNFPLGKKEKKTFFINIITADNILVLHDNKFLTQIWRSLDYMREKNTHLNCHHLGCGVTKAWIQTYGWKWKVQDNS